MTYGAASWEVIFDLTSSALVAATPTAVGLAFCPCTSLLESPKLFISAGH